MTMIELTQLLYALRSQNFLSIPLRMPFQMYPLRKFIPNVPSYGDFERAAVHVDVNFREKYPSKRVSAARTTRSKFINLPFW